MRRSVALLFPLCGAITLFGVSATAHPTPPTAAAADVTTVGRPIRARWARSSERPIRVYIESTDTIRGWQPELVAAAWSSFRDWSTNGVPVRFVRTATRAGADVVVEWVEALPGKSIGKTWRQDVGDEINAARITLALHDHKGRRLSAHMQRGAALHEVGHLLGLDHVEHRNSIMYPQVWVTDISDGDRSALRDLYGTRAHATAD